MRLTGFAVVLTAAVCFAAPAKLPGMDAYSKGDYAAAARDLKVALDGKKLSAAESMTARMYLAAAHYALGDNASVENVLLELFRADPAARLDPNIFDPDLVALSEQTRVAEANRQMEAAALAKKAEDDLKTKELAAAAAAAKPPEVVVPVEPPKGSAPLQLRVGLFALTDVAGKPSATAALSVSAVISSFEIGARVFPGGFKDRPDGPTTLTVGAGLDVGYLFLDGPLNPRVGARVSFYPGLSNGAGGTAPGFGGGLVGGVRYNVTDFVAVGADVSGEMNQTQGGSRYRSFSAVLQGGAQLLF